MNKRRMAALLLALAMVLSLTGCLAPAEQNSASEQPAAREEQTPPAEPREEAGAPAESDKELPEEAPPEETFEAAAAGPEESGSEEAPPAEAPLPEDGSYTTKEDVARYIYQYGRLPGNFITKKEAEALGWPGGSLEPYAPGKCIGGSRFGNYEGLLPDAPGRTYTECDIDTLGQKSRGAKRIVFSNDGLIYYTEDHYASFTLLYGEE